MGLGKTIQTIALLLWAKGKYKRKLNLVVAPTSVVPNWEREINKFAPSLKTVVWQGPNRHQRVPELEKADVMITSYALASPRRGAASGARPPLRDSRRGPTHQEPDEPNGPVRQEASAASDGLALTGTPDREPSQRALEHLRFRIARASSASSRQFEERIARPIDRGDMETAHAPSKRRSSRSSSAA